MNSFQSFVGTTPRTAKTRVSSRGRLHALAQALFENAPIPCVIAGADLRIQLVNPAFTRLLGYSQQEIEAMSIEQITCVDDRLATGAANRIILSGHKRFHEYAKRYLHKDGNLVPARVNVSFLCVGGERLLLGQITDLSAIRGAEDALASSNERLQMAAENAGLGVWDADLKTLKMSWDRHLRVLYELDGNAPDPSIPEWLAMIHEADRNEVRSRVDRCLAKDGEDTFDVDFRIGGCEGTRWLRSRGQVQRDEVGYPRRAVGINIDVTASKLLAEERIEHAETVRKALEGTVRAITTALEIRDPYTAGHQLRVAKIAVAIGRELGLADSTLEGIKLAAELHDIGKIGIPAEILSKPGRLSEAQYNLIKTHAEAGYQILKDVKFPWPIAEIVYQHHEQMDGTGYPRGLSGDQILLEARVIGVADTLEAMSAYRPYRPALGLKEALRELSLKRGASYDAHVVDACLRCFADKTELVPVVPTIS